MTGQKSITPEEVGAVVRHTRKALNVTQQDLALASGTGLRFIIDLEKGKPSCQFGKTLTVLQALGIRIDLVLPGGVIPLSTSRGEPIERA